MNEKYNFTDKDMEKSQEVIFYHLRKMIAQAQFEFISSFLAVIDILNRSNFNLEQLLNDVEFDEKWHNLCFLINKLKNFNVGSYYLEILRSYEMLTKLFFDYYKLNNEIIFDGVEYSIGPYGFVIFEFVTDFGNENTLAGMGRLIEKDPNFFLALPKNARSNSVFCARFLERSPKIYDFFDLIIQIDPVIMTKMLSISKENKNLIRSKIDLFFKSNSLAKELYLDWCYDNGIDLVKGIVRKREEDKE